MVANIEIQDDVEFTPTIADLIKTIANLKSYELLIWVNVSEIPFKLDANCNYLFLQESVKVKRGNQICYIFYDMISGINVII